MKKHLNLLFLFAKNGLMGQMEFRTSFILWFIGNVFWMFVELISIQIIFSQTQSIAGWSKSEAIILILVFELILSFIWLFLLPSLNNFHNLIDQGDFDFVLLKPVNSQFWVSTKTFEFDVLIRLVILLPVVFYLFNLLNFSPTVNNIFLFVVTLILSNIIYYNFVLCVVTSNFWLTNVFNLADFFNAINDMGRYPSDIFSKIPKAFFAYFLPSAFVATIPTLFLIGRGSLNLFLGVSLFAVFGFIFTRWFWNFAVKRYSSASS